MLSRQMSVCRWACNRIKVEPRVASISSRHNFHSSLEPEAEQDRSFLNARDVRNWKIAAAGAILTAGMLFVSFLT